MQKLSLKRNEMPKLLKKDKLLQTNQKNTLIKLNQ